MSRGYTRICSDVAYAARLPSSAPSIAIATSKMRVVRLNMGSEGRVTDLTIKQEETDAQLAFEAELLKSKIPYPIVDSDISTATTPADTVGLYRVVPKMAAAAGDAFEFDEQNMGYNYKNMDGNYSNNQPYLYLLIKPISSAGTSTWKVSITVERNVGG